MTARSNRVISVVAVLAGVLTGVLAARDAHAYPQFQLSRDQTCTACHFSPSGGGLLTENGLATAEAISQFGTAPEFVTSALTPPSWLVLGGDVRMASGYVQTPEHLLTTFPMQGEGYARAELGRGLSLYVNVGGRQPQDGHEATTFLWSREHYLMWKSDPDGNAGLFVRVGRLGPVFGLHLVEHEDYVEKWGGTPLYDEAYGAAIEYVTARWEAHATGWIKDDVIDTPEHSSGAAGLTEVRITPRFALGAEAMLTRSDDDRKYRVGALAKWFVPGVDTLLLFEGEYANQLVEPRGAPKQLVALLMASKYLAAGYMLDVGVNFFDENVEITGLHREALDVDLHWFATSHVEALFTGRIEVLDFGRGGPSAGYALLQAHYRL